METQGWALYAARRGTGQVYAVVGWEFRTADRGRRAIGVELGPELDGGPAAELGDAMVYCGDYQQAYVVAFGGTGRPS